MSPVIINALCLAAIAFLQVLTIWIKSVSDARIARKLAETGAATDKQLSNIHTLVNNAMGIQLTLYAKKARDLANLTGSLRDAEDASLAESKLKEHMAKQAIVDGEK